MPGRLARVSTGNSSIALIAGIATFVVVLYSDSFATMFALWQTGNHAHGLLVFPISAYLMWNKRRSMGDSPIRADLLGLIFLVPALFAWLIACLAGVQVIEHFMVLAIIPITVLAIAGRQIFGVLIFPLCFLLFATPLGEGFVPVLMKLTAEIATSLLRLSGIPFLRDGQYISLPGGEFVVADVCSGLRYLMTGTMVIVLFGYLSFKETHKTVVLIIVTALVLVVTNGIRAYIVMSVASATEMQYLAGRDHIYFGWFLFGIVLVGVMYAASRFANKKPANETSAGSAMSDAWGLVPLVVALGLMMLAITLKPLQSDFGVLPTLMFAVLALFLLFIVTRNGPGLSDSSVTPAGTSDGSGRESPHRSKMALPSVAVLIPTVLALSAAPVYAGLMAQRAASVDTIALTAAALPCTVAGDWSLSFTPSYVGAYSSVSKDLTCAFGTAGVFIANYSSADQGHELISRSNTAVPRSLDRYTDKEDLRVELLDGIVIRVTEYCVEADGERTRLWQWFSVNDSVYSRQYRVKIAQSLAHVLGRPDGGEVVIVAVPLTTDDAADRQRLSEIAARLIEPGLVDG